MARLRRGRLGKVGLVIRRIAVAALVIPAYVFASAVFVIFLVVLGIVLGTRVVEAMSDYGPSYSVASTKRCLEERGRDVEYHVPGPGFGELIVKPYRRGGISEEASLWFAPTAHEAKGAEVSDSERRRRRGNVLFQTLLAGATPSDPAIDECLDRSHRKG